MGYGNHWQLSADERKALGKRLVDAADTLPQSTITKYAELFGKYMPWIALPVTATIITAPRVQLTRAMLQAQMQERAESAAKENVPDIEPNMNGRNTAAAYSRIDDV